MNILYGLYFQITINNIYRKYFKKHTHTNITQSIDFPISNRSLIIYTLERYSLFRDFT